MNSRKKFNDRYGHLAGDYCLVQVAGVIDASVRRPGDLAARYGGEDFAIVAANCGGKDALTLAEMLREKIEQLAK